jgi:hypothetical protein
MENSDARGVMRRIEEDVEELGQAGMAGEGGRLVERLTSDWSELLSLIGPMEDPFTRDCPSCGRMGTPGATRCGYCWAALEPLAAPVGSGKGEEGRRSPTEQSALSAFESEGGAL